MNILVLYNETQTYTNAVYEHLQALEKYSTHRYFFLHISQKSLFRVDLARFDAVCVHFSLRLPFDQVPDPVAESLQNFSGLKFLFIQDEYDNTHHVWSWIQRLRFHIVFTVVPEKSIFRVYPPQKFPDTKFVSILTGYVPIELKTNQGFIPPSKRSLVVGYRGRKLPLRYGALGFEKVGIGAMVAEYCKSRGIAYDISWKEEDRIYGVKWVEFLYSCRAMLGTESGSNIFDWDGKVEDLIADYKKKHPNATETEVYREVLSALEVDGLMNQISPKIFEAIAARTVLVLYEGSYSGVLKPNEHYISLKKDGSNIAEVFHALSDGQYVDLMVGRAYQDIIESGAYGYPALVKRLDDILSSACVNNLTVEFGGIDSYDTGDSPDSITTGPIRSTNSLKKHSGRRYIEWDGDLRVNIPLGSMWQYLPKSIQSALFPMARYFRDKITKENS
ncbi:hypothetical protein [Castellaniella sp. GW247-6E4]|uniref:hypothetical protein n=1 Tax=Castellaniella sp. GW247-6E4 TaxID=3140380 RepID=UPI00331646BD